MGGSHPLIRSIKSPSQCGHAVIIVQQSDGNVHMILSIAVKCEFTDTLQCSTVLTCVISQLKLLY